MLPLLPLGALMLARLPRNAIGWLLCGTVLGTALSVAAQEYATYSHFVDRLPAEPWIGWLGQWASGASLWLVTVAPLLFPTGRLPSRRWRPALWVGLLGPVLLAFQGLVGPPEDLKFLDNPIFKRGFLHNVSDAGGIGWFLMLPAAGLGIAALVVRRRTATGETREQLRLLLRAAVVVTLAFIACLIGSFVAPRALDLGATAWWLSLGFLAGTMAVAILRHRLYGLDVYVNRGLVYTGLTVVLGGLYIAAVARPRTPARPEREPRDRATRHRAGGRRLPTAPRPVAAEASTACSTASATSRTRRSQRLAAASARRSARQRFCRRWSRRSRTLSGCPTSRSSWPHRRSGRPQSMDPRRRGSRCGCLWFTAASGWERSSSAPAPTAKHSARPTADCSRTSFVTRQQP